MRTPFRGDTASPHARCPENRRGSMSPPGHRRRFRSHEPHLESRLLGPGRTVAPPWSSMKGHHRRRVAVSGYLLRVSRRWRARVLAIAGSHAVAGRSHAPSSRCDTPATRVTACSEPSGVPTFDEQIAMYAAHRALRLLSGSTSTGCQTRPSRRRGWTTLARPFRRSVHGGHFGRHSSTLR